MYALFIVFHKYVEKGVINCGKQSYVLSCKFM